jgi:ABC-type sugar transport system substrate-binding protein
MRKKCISGIAAALLLLLVGMTAACGSKAAVQDEESGENKTGSQPVIGLILTSEDAPENEAVAEAFQKAAEKAGARLEVRMPEVTWAEARMAEALTDDFVLCEVDPIEYQMLIVDELVAENVDVIAIHANHSEALTPVLQGARAVGIRVCAFGTEVEETACDSYSQTEEAPEAAAGLLSGE